MFLRIGVVVNPRSRYLRRHPEAVARLERVVGRRGPVAVTTDLPSVEDAARRFRADGVDVVGVVGGDGTAGIVARAVANAWDGEPHPPLALLRGGTMNTVANALGLPRGLPEARLLTLLRATAGGSLPPVMRRTTLDVAGRAAFLFGTGVFESFLRAYYGAGDGDPSAVTAALTIARAAASALVQGAFIKELTAPVVAALEIDGERLPERAYMAHCAGTVSQVGLGFTPFHLADTVDDAFHFLALHGSSAVVVRDLGRVWRGRAVRPRSGRDFVAREVVIHPAGGRLTYMADGDLFEHGGPLTVRVGPRVPIVRI
ncbi:MAG: NAD(+)/NADH kinase [Deltaproteobacteria bacterium]|nr:NAD(+)/NADH kinase [Deltaproteobacteria bacterium]